MGGAGALALLASSKQAQAYQTYGQPKPSSNSDSLFLLDPVTGWKICPATDDTLQQVLDAVKANAPLSGALDISDRSARLLGHIAVDGSVGVTNANLDSPVSGLKADLDSLLTKAGVLGNRNWTITETVPMSNAALNANLSTLAKESGGNLASILAQLDTKTSLLATQATLAAIKAQTDKLTFDVSNSLNTVGLSVGVDPVGIKYTGLLGQIDPRQIRSLTSADVVSAAQSGTWTVGLSASQIIDVIDRQARLAGRVSVAASDGGAAIDPRVIRALTSADVVDVSDRSTRLAGRHSVSATDGGAAIDPRDVLDRAARLLGTVSPVSGSTWDISDRSTRLAGRHSISATDGGAAIDPRAIRALTSADVVSAAQSGSWTIGSITNAIDVSDRAARALGLVGPAAASVWDVADRSARLAGRVSVAAADGGAAVDPRDTLDRAARLLGRIYGSQGQQLLQTATNFNSQVELATGATLYDARVTRALTSADVVTVQAITTAPDISDRAARLIGQVSLGTSSGKTNVLKTGNLVTTAVTADQVILTYTVTVGKTFYLEYLSMDARLTTFAATATFFGAASLETPSGTKGITDDLSGTGAVMRNPYIFAEPIPIAAGVVIRVVCTPSAVTSFTWKSSFGGFEK